MGLLEDLQSKADANGDGKITKEDLESLASNHDDIKDQIEQLKSLADQNEDGKLSVDDAKNIDFGNLLSDAKDALGGLFDKK